MSKRLSRWHKNRAVPHLIRLPQGKAWIDYDEDADVYLTKILRSGECIEDYPDDHPFPSGLFFGWHQDKPLLVVAALDETAPEVYIITTYAPDQEHFEADFRTRRKK